MEKLGYELNPEKRNVEMKGCAWARNGFFGDTLNQRLRSGENGFNPVSLKSEAQSFRPTLKPESK